MLHLCLVAAVSGLSLGAYVANVWALVSAVILVFFLGSAFDLIFTGQFDNASMTRWVAVVLAMQLGYLIGAMARHLVEDRGYIFEEEER
ncbi:hypothetical protein DWF00_04325 [Bosea caraganae]|uniref:Uncharacterized protein n=2 Tax=Bosea caraganae TaxID=2763117 RepID=A0A370KXX1_9HYPH|nr:hypothetical protein DWE98_27795 [Bosea caraganae]RDJ30039.1 hypothetical protein DWF00_04325 [Bosea caraganae]